MYKLLHMIYCTKNQKEKTTQRTIQLVPVAQPDNLCSRFRVCVAGDAYDLAVCHVDVVRPVVLSLERRNGCKKRSQQGRNRTQSKYSYSVVCQTVGSEQAII